MVQHLFGHKIAVIVILKVNTHPVVLAQERVDFAFGMAIAVESVVWLLTLAAQTPSERSRQLISTYLAGALPVNKAIDKYQYDQCNDDADCNGTSQLCACERRRFRRRHLFAHIVSPQYFVMLASRVTPYW